MFWFAFPGGGNDGVHRLPRNLFFELSLVAWRSSAVGNKKLGMTCALGAWNEWLDLVAYLLRREGNYVLPAGCILTHR